MIASFVTRLVNFCIRHPWWAILFALILGVGGAFYVDRDFAINTDVNKPLSSDLPWKKRAAQYATAFSERGIVVVLEAPTLELADDAASRLSEALKAHQDLFAAVDRPGGGSFFARTGLLFLPTEDLSRVTQGLKTARIVITRLAADPSLRGTLGALSLAIDGVDFGQIKLDDLTPVMNAASDTLSDVLANRPASFSWRALASGKPSKQRDLTRFIEIAPVLNFRALQPGRVATPSRLCRCHAEIFGCRVPGKSVIWCASHSVVGCSVTANPNYRRRNDESNRRGTRCCRILSTRNSASSRYRGLKKSNSKRTKRVAIAITRPSCSDSMITASRGDGVFGSDSGIQKSAPTASPASRLSFSPRSLCAVPTLLGCKVRFS
jgi:hypothetical protein